MAKHFDYGQQYINLEGAVLKTVLLTNLIIPASLTTLVSTKNYRQVTYSAYGLHLWISLPEELRESHSASTFR